MADQSKIEWTDATWNPITGCTLVSRGCENCYAAELAASRLKNHSSRIGLARRNAAGVAKFTGEVRFNKKVLTDPRRWPRARKIFVCAHGDLFHEGVPDSWIDQVFAVMALCPQHVFQVLTKRPERMRDYFKDQPRARRRWEDILRNDYGIMTKSPPPVLPNVWLGVSVEDQETANERIPALLETPAAIRFLSAEPLLGPLNLNHVDIDSDSVANVLRPDTWRDLWRDGWCGTDGCEETELASFNDWYGVNYGSAAEIPDTPGINRIDWVIVGGESGRNARPMHPDWVRSLRDQCAEAHVPFLFKQWGAWHAISQMADGAADGLYRSKRTARSGESQAALDDIYGRTCTVPELVLQNDGHHVAVTHPNAFRSEFQSVHAFRVGKKAAGRSLDGVVHDGFPGEPVRAA